MQVDPEAYRQAMRQLPTGVVVITTPTGRGGYHGLTVNSFCGVSEQPPLIAVCVDKLARGHDHLTASQRFTVSILARRQQFLADRFAGRAPGVTAQFEGVPHFIVGSSCPVLEGCLGWLDCQISAAHHAGDHTLFVASVLAADSGSNPPPLIFFRGRYVPLLQAMQPEAGASPNPA